MAASAMIRYEKAKEDLLRAPVTWTVTGAAGFIGCNLVKSLLDLGQRVVGLDNFSTGKRRNLEQIADEVGAEKWRRFSFIEGDITDAVACREATKGVHYVIHLAALGSVPRSIEDPLTTNQSNITGFLNMIVATRDSAARRFVYAASSSTYGDHPGLPKVEDRIGRPLSPYAVTKYVNELYADVFGRTYATDSIGLRYFNVFGPHQDPDGAYAAVIPKWIGAILSGEPVVINGDGETSRDFCYVENAIQANLLAATAAADAGNMVFNVAVGERTTLNELYRLIISEAQLRFPDLRVIPPQYLEFRSGDVRHSLASVEKARTVLGYEPSHTVTRGLKCAMDWYVDDFAERPGRAPRV